MKDKCFYFNGDIKDFVKLEGDEFLHLFQVMRAKVGDSVTLINGDGFFYKGKITGLTKKYADIKILSKEKSEAEPKIELSVFQALAKGDKLSTITQKISELGATSLNLFESKFTDVKAGTHKPERLSAIAVSASKQCGRASILEISKVYTIQDVCKMVKNYDKFYVAYEKFDGVSLSSKLQEIDSESKIAVMVGAEGGFDESEIDTLEKAGAELVSLGKRILRTETASIVMSALVMQILEK